MGRPGGLTVRVRHRKMTLKNLGDIVIWLGAVAGALYAIWLMLRAAVVNPIRKSIGAELTPLANRLIKVEHKVTNLDTRMSDHIVTHSSMMGSPTNPQK